jgi:RNA 2',3'-cyclic 3'-phosphodiesterase
MAKSATSLRLFVAAYPPADVQRWLVNRLRKLDLPPHKPTELEQVHLTLQFIGDVEQRELARTVESVHRAAGGLEAFVLRPHTLISLPQRGAARLVAAACDAPPALLELQRRLAWRLADPSRRARETFLPHLTLCRFPPRMIEPLEMAVACDAFEVERVMLMRSSLRPRGVRHELVEAVQLQRRDAPS